MRAQETEAWTKWRGLLTEQRESGRSAVGFCRERGLREWQFYAWKKRIRAAEAEKFVEVKVVRADKPQLLAPAQNTKIEIRLSTGRSLVVEPGFDVQHLRSLLAVLETA